jgi:hypothetical protein
METQSFERFFDDGLNYEVMFKHIREMIQALPQPYGNIIKFDCLTGLRPAEGLESIRLINDKDAFVKYHKPERTHWSISDSQTHSLDKQRRLSGIEV